MNNSSILRKAFYHFVIAGMLFSAFFGQESFVAPAQAAEPIAPDYVLDMSFDPGTGASSWIWDITPQPDAKILIGGTFTTYNGIARRGIARLSPDGSLDSTFDPGTGAVGYVGDILVLADDKILMGGGFISYNGLPMAGLARLNSDGSLDDTFVPEIGTRNSLYALALQPDHKIIIAGCFTGNNCAVAPNIGRLNSDGSQDVSFDPGLGADYSISRLVLLPDGKILIGGQFHTYDSTPRPGIARLNSDGSLDTSFNPVSLTGGSILSVVLQPDGKVLIGGSFAISDVPGNRAVARLNIDGSLDTTFTPGIATSGSVRSIALRPDGKMLVGGFFSKYNDVTRNHLALLNSDGSLNLDFSPGSGTNGSEPTINTIVLQPDNIVLLGGSFTGYDGVLRNRIARLKPRTELPGPFGKLAPVQGADDLFLEAMLQWDASNNQATSYEYCYDTIDNNICDDAWTNNGLNTSVYLGPLKLNRWTTYYWQVRAMNGLGPTYADGGTWRTFSTDFRMVVPCSNPEWSCENVDQKLVENQLGENGNTVLGLRTSTDLDPQGYPHIVYLQLDQMVGRRDFYLKYAYWDGSQWTIQVLDTVLDWHAIPSIKVDSQNVVHISYFKGLLLKHITWDGSSWSANDVGNEQGKYLSMDLDQNDWPHLSYCSGTNLKYANWNGSTWNIQVVSTNAACGADTGPETTLALDSNDQPHILFKDDTVGLTYALWNGSDWDFRVISSSGGGTARLALDAQGHPHIAYTENSLCGGSGCVALKYTTMTGNDWIETTLTPWSTRGYSVGGITVDGQGQPHISFSRAEAGISYLQHAHWDGDSWVTVVVQDEADAGSVFHAPVVIAPDQTASICFHYTETIGQEVFTNLRCATDEPPPVTTSWTVQASMSIGRSRAAAASVNGKVYVIGGRSLHDIGTIEQTVEEYDPVTHTWTNKSLKPTQVSDTGAAVIQNKIYVAGGYNFTESVSAVEVYDPATNQWSSVAPLPVALSMHTVTAVDNRLYVMGGYDGKAVLDTCRVYDPVANAWSVCAPMPHARTGAGAGVVNGKIYVVGGWGAKDYVDEYDPATNSWVTRAPLQTGRSFPGVAGYGDFLYVCGGGYPMRTPKKSCEKFDPALNTWSAFDHLNHDRTDLSLVEAGGRLYAIGGWDQSHSTINEESARLPIVCNTLTITINPVGSGTVTSSPSQTCPGGYGKGTGIRLAASPKPGYAFHSWSGDAFGSTSPIDVSLSADMAVTANFVKIAAQTFADVPADHWAWNFIERLYAAGITGGCGTSPLQYCPEITVTRSQMAVFLLRGIHGSSYSPPAVGSSTGFGDVPVDYWSAVWIKQLAADGITGGCGSGNYCPEYPVTRDQMAVFLLRSKYGASYSPPAVGASTGFGDVPVDHWAAPWIKQLVTEGITAGCGNGNYCPGMPVTRAQMAVFLVRTFNLP